jgi:recombination protein RecT
MTAVTRTQADSPVAVLRRELAARETYFRSLLPEGYEPDRLITGALMAVSKNPDLVGCTPASLALACATIAQWGLDIGTTAHLVPFGKSCTPIVDYKGYIELICQAGARKVEAYVVREGDLFEVERGTNEFLRHVPQTSTGEITHAYAIVTLRGGVQQFEVMTAEEIDKIRQEKSKSWKRGPLTSWYARKTVIRQVAKYVPKTARLQAAMLRDEEELPEAEVSAATDAELEARFRPERTGIVRPVAQPTDPYDPETGEVLGGAEVGEQEQGDAFEGGL